MNLFFAYMLAVCPALNSVISALLGLVVVCVFFCIFVMANEPEGSEDYQKAKASALLGIKLLTVLAILWVLVPDQKRLNTMMLNHQATYETRDAYGVLLGDK